MPRLISGGANNSDEDDLAFKEKMYVTFRLSLSFVFFSSTPGSDFD